MTTKADKEAQKKLATNKPCEFDNALINQGINGPYLAKKLKEELEAEELTKFYDGKGSIKGKREAVAWAIRQKARQDAHKLRGDYPPEKVDHKFTDLPTMTVVVREAMKEENGSD